MREALEMALDALEIYGAQAPAVRQTIATIKEALAQPEQEIEYKERILRLESALAKALAQPDYRAVKTYHEGKPVYVSQPEQEPVAIDVTIEAQDPLEMLRDMLVQEDGELTSIRLIVGSGQFGYGLYVLNAEYPEEGAMLLASTTPPKRPWIGLTEAENAICLGFNKVLGLQYQEAKLKELNT